MKGSVLVKAICDVPSIENILFVVLEVIAEWI